VQTTSKVTWILASFLLALTPFAIYSGATAARTPNPPAPLRRPLDAIPAPGGAAAPEGGPIEPELLRALARATPDEYIRIIVRLRERADLEAVIGVELSAAETRDRVVSALQATAAKSQARLRSRLEEARAAGLVDSYTPFWIFNGVAVRAQPSLIQELASRPDISTIQLDHHRQWLKNTPNLQPPPSKFQPPNPTRQTPTANEWGILRIRADEVWSALHISGAGAVVAGMDTGVDWLHPALQANYRGYNPHGPSNHTYSWYDATGGALYPVDGHGHGSHTMGTIAGQDGIGVAPGAQWIAVKVLNNQGYGYDSWIHAGFQWTLAPGGEPSKAPDVLNCSWGNNFGSLTTFQPDLKALRAAGIFAVFSNGNNGPAKNTVGSPASLPEAFAVGATDYDDEVANFSSRGPSPWGEIRPHVAAPGVGVRSSLPGGAYGSKQGTSMAAPHVSGIAALLRSVSPTLSITRTAFIITSTAVPLGDPIPNNDAGWGRVDGFAAVAKLANPGFITGTVTWAAGGTPIAGATVAATPHSGGGSGTATTGEDGAYLLALAPGVYDLRVSAFGYQPVEAHDVAVTNGATTARSFVLTALPFGILRGQATDAATGQPLTATVTVLGTPLKVTSDTYHFTLPTGSYTIHARSLGHRVVTATATVTAGQYIAVNLALPPAPSILLVDSGGWYYGSQASYFRQALDDLGYAYDEWPIKHLPEDLPTANDLLYYDIVVWSAPQDAPGYTGAENAVVGYLNGGGRLFLSGQDVGYLDGGGMLFYAHYYHDYLKAQLVRDNANAWTLEGVAGDIFAGMKITITGAGGADNQDFPDEIAVADPDAAAPVFAYREDSCGGVRVGVCLDYRVVYLSFGFEAINDPGARQEVMGRALEWLAKDPPSAGLELTPVAQTRIGPPGAVVTHALRLRHLGQRGVIDTVSLTLDGASWDSQLSAPSLTLYPCASATVVVSVTVPLSASWDIRDALTLTARSSLSPTLSRHAVLTTKAPAPLLLVDDDRWYEQVEKYRAAMDGASMPYDLWQINAAVGSARDRSPPLAVLQEYPIVIWWTGYDWYRPVTAEEEATLAAYLDGGGRLFLSSQDFMYYHQDGLLSRDYLGVLSYTESTTPTQAVGAPENPIGDRLGPYGLSYPFDNCSDAVKPAPGTGVPFRDQERRGIALNRREGERAAVLFTFPFETLPEKERPAVMERVVGWLSWLGRSTFAADRGAVSGGDTLTYTAVLRNDGPAAITASFSNTLPLSLTLISGSLVGPAAYASPARRISWEGSLEPSSAVTLTYRVTVASGSPAGDIVNAARLGLEDQGIHFRKAAVVQVDAPDLSPSYFACAPSHALPGGAITCTLSLVNGGPGDASAAATSLAPTHATLITDSLAWEGGGAAEALIDRVHWAGPLTSGSSATITYRLAAPTSLLHPPLYSVAFLEDGAGGKWERAAWSFVQPLRQYLPLALRDDR